MLQHRSYKKMKGNLHASMTAHIEGSRTDILEMVAILKECVKLEDGESVRWCEIFGRWIQ